MISGSAVNQGRGCGKLAASGWSILGLGLRPRRSGLVLLPGVDGGGGDETSPSGSLGLWVYTDIVGVVFSAAGLPVVCVCPCLYCPPPQLFALVEALECLPEREAGAPDQSGHHLRRDGEVDHLLVLGAAT